MFLATTRKLSRNCVAGIKRQEQETRVPALRRRARHQVSTDGSSRCGCTERGAVVEIMHLGHRHLMVTSRTRIPIGNPAACVAVGNGGLDLDRACPNRHDEIDRLQQLMTILGLTSLDAMAEDALGWVVLD